MYVVCEAETGWSSEDMRFAEWADAQEYIRNMSERGYDMTMRVEQ
jgi:hypothetical protein